MTFKTALRILTALLLVGASFAFAGEVSAQTEPKPMEAEVKADIPDTAELLANIANFKTLRTKFVQTKHLKAFKKPMVLNGELCLDRPGKRFAWHVEKPLQYSCIIANGKLKASLTKTFIAFKTTIWIITIIPTVFWFIVSKERVPQSEKPPHPVKGILSVFRNRPLLIYTLTGLIGGIDIGSGEDLYYNDVLKFNMLPTVAGIPGMPVSYASYALAPKFRQRFSTKMLWYFSNGSIFISEALFFLTGLIGGEKHGFYQKKLPMSIAFGVGNLIEMVFYATKGIVGKEIDYEVLDYCEWKNGFRVEATIKLINGYFTKAKDAILKIVNAHLLQDWAQYEIGETAIQTQQTKWRLFLIAFGPHLIFDFLALLPMLFYNIDKDTRERMYIDLERARAKRALMEKLETDEKNA